MDYQIKYMKDKISSLMNRNKQLDAEIKSAQTQEIKDSKLKEKEANNNQLRKERTNRYELEQIKEDIRFMKKSCMLLQKLGLIKSQYEFSSEYLRRTKHYLSMLLTENRLPSVDSISCLIKKLIDIRQQYDDFDNKDTINRHLDNIITEGQQLITKRLIRYW